jgi:hypothetical protein
MCDTPTTQSKSTKRKDISPLAEYFQVEKKERLDQLEQNDIPAYNMEGGNQGGTPPDWAWMMGQLKKMDNIDKLVGMEETLNKLATTQTTMETALTHQGTEITKLEEANTKMAGDIFRLETRCNDLERQCTYTESELTRVKKDVTWQEAIIKKTNLVISGVRSK